MTAFDFANNVFDAFRPHLSIAVSLLMLWGLIKITDASVVGTVTHVWREIVGAAQGNKGPMTVNAFGGLLTFAVILFLYFGGLGHLSAEQHVSDFKYGVAAVVVFIIGGYFILCVKVTSNLER